MRISHFKQWSNNSNKTLFRKLRHFIQTSLLIWRSRCLRGFAIAQVSFSIRGVFWGWKLLGEFGFCNGSLQCCILSNTFRGVLFFEIAHWIPWNHYLESTDFQENIRSKLVGKWEWMPVKMGNTNILFFLSKFSCLAEEIIVHEKIVIWLGNFNITVPLSQNLTTVWKWVHLDIFCFLIRTT